MESSKQSQNQGQSRSGTQETLTPEASKALGNLSPALAWLELSNRVVSAEDRDSEAQRVLEEEGYSGDLENLQVLMSKYSPVEGINLLVEANPTFEFGKTGFEPKE